VSLSVSVGWGDTAFYATIINAPWDRGPPSSATPAPHRMLQEQKFFFLASWAIAFALSCFYGRSLRTG